MSQETVTLAPGASDVPAPSFGEALATWARIGVLSFGGPTAQIALMHRIIVDEKQWLSERQYLNALSFCMLLPGPEAMQLATYAGWRLHGTIGGLAAGLLFVLPGALVVLALAMIYASLGNVPVVEALLLGFKAAVLVIVVEALLRVARRSLKRIEHWVTAGVAFAAIFFLAVPFPVIIAAAALAGFLSSRTDDGNAGAPALTHVPLRSTASTVALWLVIWFAPLVTVAAIFGGGHVLTQLGWFFSKLAVVTFGGAYSVLAYMAQDVVVRHGWLSPEQMLDGLGLAETTPGPLILVTEFVGYLAAFQHGGEPAMVMGLLGALVALWATFAPCFLWIFAGAPHIEWIASKPRLRSALTFVTAAVVGVILNLAVWFALHVMFADVAHVQAWPFQLWVPDLASVDWRIAVLTILSAILLIGRHWSIGAVLLVASACGLALSWPGL